MSARGLSLRFQLRHSLRAVSGYQRDRGRGPHRLSPSDLRVAVPLWFKKYNHTRPGADAYISCRLRSAASWGNDEPHLGTLPGSGGEAELGLGVPIECTEADEIDWVYHDELMLHERVWSVVSARLGRSGRTPLHACPKRQGPP
jgi:hypothetical protein